MGFKIKKTVNGETVWEPIKAKKYTASKTIEYTGTLPITINANGQPLLDYQISGNTEQTGTPTPENPIMPIGCGEKTENLWDKDVPSYNYVDDYKKYNPNNAIALKAGTYTLSSNGRLPTIQAFSESHTQLNVTDALTYISNYYLQWNGMAIGPTSPTVRVTTIILLCDCILTFCVTSDLGTYLMLNTGSTAPDQYIPYGYKLPILSNSTVTNIYLGEVETTRRIKKLVLTGTEYWTTVTRPTYTYATSITPYVNSSAVSSHFIQKDFIILANKTFTLFNKNKIYIKYDDTTSVDDFKQFLADQYAAGTPVTVWYVLAEPETGIVNEPLMKIGDYADTVSMEQAGASIPTYAGTTTIDYDGTPKPSQMYIKYNSWSGWSDIDNYKMVNGNWAQEMT